MPLAAAVTLAHLPPRRRPRRKDETRVGHGQARRRVDDGRLDLDKAEAEGLINQRTKVVSIAAVSNVLGTVNPVALETLDRHGVPLPEARSKSWDEFAAPGAPEMDFVFTVCDTAAAEECPPWPGQPITGHWGLPDPVKATGTDAEKALVFAQTYAALRRRIMAFVELPFGSLGRMSLQSRVDAIGADAPAKA